MKEISYRRVLSSMRDKLKESALIKDKTAKESLDEVYCYVGDVMKARSVGQLPRRLGDLYNARHSAKKSATESFREEDGLPQNSNKEQVNLRNVWTLHIHRIYSRTCFLFWPTTDSWNKLGSFAQIPTISVSLVSTQRSTYLINLTVTTYRNLRLVSKSTNKPPVFIGPLLMQQHKEWNAYSKFAYSNYRDARA